MIEEEPVDDVFIFGAGFSYDANIPLLSNFINVMIDGYSKKRIGETDLSEEDLTLLGTALSARAELDNFHGRVRYDDRNIEDILSILSYNTFSNDLRAQEKFDSFSKAISATIENSCDVEYGLIELPGSRKDIEINNGSSVYYDFWNSFFEKRRTSGRIPAIISMNYDLVLERSLLQFMNGKEAPAKDFDFHSYSIDYHSQIGPQCQFSLDCSTRVISSFEMIRGPETIMDRSSKLMCYGKKGELSIDLLKLHGSVNFSEDIDVMENYILTPVENPLIIPPVSNKQSQTSIASIWTKALQTLRQAKRITFVGYSLPQTDLNMSYFFKSALGPNAKFDRITVFDPVLFGDKEGADQMKKRFENCFSEQVCQRIDFNPPLPKKGFFSNDLEEDDHGTTEHFVQLLQSNPEYIFY